MRFPPASPWYALTHRLVEGGLRPVPPYEAVNKSNSTDLATLKTVVPAKAGMYSTYEHMCYGSPPAQG